MEVIIELSDDSGITELSDKALRYFMMSSEEQFTNEIKDHTPVITNNLKSSWTPHLEKQGKQLRIATSVHYAPYVEDGTRYFEGRHMVKEGSKSFAPKIPNLLFNAIYRTSKL